MAGIRAAFEAWLTLQDDQAREQHSQPYGTGLVLLLSFIVVALLFLVSLAWLPEALALPGLWVLPLLIVLASVVSSPTAVLIVGFASVALGAVLSLTLEAMADYVVTAPVTLLAVTGLAWLTAQRFQQIRTHFRLQRVQWAARETTLNEQVEAQNAELTALRQAQESWQEAAKELAPPVLPVWEGVLVLPFVGPFDEARAKLARHTLLQAIEAHRAHTAILDVTGLSGVTAETIKELTNITQGVELTGCQAIVAGVRPDLAQQMAELRTKLGSAVTRRNLQAGIAYALRRDTSREHSGAENAAPQGG
jgi:anti-anti-sigma regulatory factor